MQTFTLRIKSSYITVFCMPEKLIFWDKALINQSVLQTTTTKPVICAIYRSLYRKDLGFS